MNPGPLLKQSIHGAEVTSITFLVDVNDTYQHIPPFDNSSYACVTTVKTDPLYPDTPANKSKKIVMGNCDSGTLTFTVSSDKKGNTTVTPTLRSRLIRAASCSINWDYSYLLPGKDNGPGSMDDAEESLLPGCFVSYPAGEVQLISYWFYILDWDVTFKEGIKCNSILFQDQVNPFTASTAKTQ